MSTWRVRNDINGPAWRKQQIGINYEATVGNDFTADALFFANSAGGEKKACVVTV